MRRAAVSIPSNIVEGAGRTGDKEFLKFLSVARGSLRELETQFLLAMELRALLKIEIPSPLREEGAVQDVPMPREAWMPIAA